MNNPKNPETQEDMPEIGEALKRAGITNLRTLVKITHDSHRYKFVPNITITVDLTKDKKGVHMSRLIESVTEVVESEAEKLHISIEQLEKRILNRLAEKHPYGRAVIEMKTELVVRKKTPVTKKPTMETHDISVSMISENGKFTKKLRVDVVGNTVCPHAMQMVGKPHIQRAVGILEIEAEYSNDITLEEMIDCVERSFSSEVYTLLKSQDEAYVIEKMFKNPKFVEDVCRGIIYRAKKTFKGCKINAKVISQESIHRHDVIAEGEAVV
ncbi:MAG: GTP cyclohydrolase [Candidatus Altiarchaeales archaeon IMC4]|nr:MAG: GTP cyclohydrolase [Candidatus Altiarchaeales archaeon IMC4]